MPHVSQTAAHVESDASSVDASRNSRDHDHPTESPPLRDGPLEQQATEQQRHIDDHPYRPQQELQQPRTGYQPMAACSGTAAVESPHGDPSTHSLGSSGSAAAEGSLGQQLHQLSFGFKEQLHVDTKRTRTAPSCCNLCKSSQPSDGPCGAPGDQSSSALSCAPRATHTPSEPSNQSRGSPAAEGTTDTGETAPVLAARQEKSGEDCCLTCSCPCHSSTSNPSSSIVCFEGPRRPPTFAANLADLCREFPSVHQGLIVSLLETAENDLQRAHALVRVVSDTNTGLNNPKTGGPMSKRKRCPDAESDCLGALETSRSDLSPLGAEGPPRVGAGRRRSSGMDVAETSPRYAYSSSDQQQLHQQQLSAVAAAPADPPLPRGQGGFPRLHMPMNGELLPEAWCNEVAERLLWAIVTAASGDDAKAKAAALLREHAVQLAHAQQEEPSHAELAKEAERQDLAKRVELLQNDKLLLARAVKAQHEKLQTLQQRLAEKSEEARHLMQELNGTQQRLRSLEDAASALLLGTYTGRSSPCRDNTFDRR